MSDLQQLVAMGFPENRAAKALQKTGYKGVQQAMDWLFAHEGDADIDEPVATSTGHTLDGSGDQPAGPPAQALSLKCDECGKKLRSEQDCQAHAARTQHTQFSESTDEIKPLTAEEKKAALDKLEDLRKQRRMEREEKEKQEEKDREKVRRRSGKELVEAKQQREAVEMKLLAEQRRREKEADRLAKEKIKAELEKDKATRRAGMTPGAAAAAAAATIVPTSPTAPASATPAAAGGAAKDYSTARIQVRTLDGKPLTNKFDATATLQAVYDFVQANRTDGRGGDFYFMVTHPKQTFKRDSFGKTLAEAGLVPSAVLVMTQ